MRHQESEWNKLGKWTGRTDVHLSEKGVKDSDQMGLLIKDMKIDKAYSSNLLRTIETLNCILKICKLDTIETENAPELSERDYGDYTGKNKWEIQKQIGDDKFKDLRRGWNCPIPNGETLEDVYDRVVPFYKEKILPEILSGKNILIVAHGNSLRALLKYVENISDDEICNVEFPFNKIYTYDLDQEGKMIQKHVQENNYDSI
jgi:2,3-bisphosphoglycerate-dependent phosphoglycerate mutase